LLISVTSYGVFNLFVIHQKFAEIHEKKNTGAGSSDSFQPLFNFSKNGKNVVIVMLDKAIAGYVPYVFEEKPELLSRFSGFVWYPNCVSFGGHTYVGAPPVYGGYEYAPLEINKHGGVPLEEKYKEAYQLLPYIFSKLDYSVTITDPPFESNIYSNLSVFDGIPNVTAENITGKYTALWLQEHPEIVNLNISEHLKNNLIRFSLFKISPFLLRLFIYDHGEWLRIQNIDSINKINGRLTFNNIDDYAFLDYLTRMTSIQIDAKGSFISIYGHLTHNSPYLQAPEYVPQTIVTDMGSGPFAQEQEYHATMASFILLGKWFNYLKENGVYDNTRIIIVSDHGANLNSKYPGNFLLPNGKSLQSYHTLLLSKDFNAENNSPTLEIDNSFMTNADVPLLTLKNIVNNPVNPFTGIFLKEDKKDGITLTTIETLISNRHYKDTLRINKNEWLHVRDNIFDPKKWEPVTVP
jgi:hypothetical protein